MSFYKWVPRAILPLIVTMLETIMENFIQSMADETNFPKSSQISVNKISVRLLTVKEVPIQVSVNCWLQDQKSDYRILVVLGVRA